MIKTLVVAVAGLLLLAGCSYKPPKPVEVAVSHEEIDYLESVKPILDKRCVSCHSCYNSPCQLKLSSFEGLERGANKEAVYNAERLKPMDPTRLFIDAKSSEEWRQKGFFSVTQNSASDGFNDSVMLQLLDHKMRHPVSEGEYHSEADDLTCAREGSEVGEFLQKNPNYGMPYGFPALKKEEYRTIAQWLQQGARGPDTVEQARLASPSVAAAGEIEKWEAFFNAPDAKHAMTARYLYEHLFLAHLNFEVEPGEFYELVRSTTPPGEPVDVIATVLPYDDPGVEMFYYRFRKIHSTIVHKTHMVFELDDAKLARFNELFIEPEWIEKPHRVGYEKVLSANPFVAFGQIPPKSRYRFLLDNSHYIIMTFIRGPVCKGQVALNVINDHFWVMFMDPEHDISVQRPLFLTAQSANLSMPIESGNHITVWRTFSDRYKKRASAFYAARQQLYADAYPEGMGIDSIWKGERAEDAPVLTIYRHFDSASVHKGVLGDLPRTLWVIDYPLFERIYYALVAGFDVYGNIGHQTNIRRYMDNLRIEGESYFTNMLPKESRRALFASWYIGSETGDNGDYQLAEMPSKIDFTSAHPKRELIETVVNGHILPETGIVFDRVNYFNKDEMRPTLPETYRGIDDYIQAFRAISMPGTAFVRQINDYNANLAYLRIKIPDRKDEVISIVVNRWHDNVDFMFRERKRLDPSKDTADFIRGFVGSYPNFFLEVELEELPEFFELLANYEGTDEDRARLFSYGVGREDANFWESFDWFQKRFEEDAPLRSGLFDLNRYYNTAVKRGE
jgi:hypothetical protein